MERAILMAKMRYRLVRRAVPRVRALALFIAASCAATAGAADLNTIGVNLLRMVTTNVNGAGVRVAQIEAETATSPPTFEVNPAASGVSQPVSRFTYYSSLGASSSYPNSVGAESGHADTVAANFYGLAGGVATNIAHVDNYDANAFVQAYYAGANFIVNLPTSNINDPVANQSFIFNNVSTSEQQAIDSAYDNYAAQYNTLFVSGVGNSGRVNPPATCYNGIGVAAYGGSSSVGPTLDNGRAKPDITAPANLTSFSTPQVSGAAAVLMQAALRGDGGGNTTAAADIRTVKALLLNGAIKPADWTNAPTSPLDARYGAGVLNVFNSYEQLTHGKHVYIVSKSVSVGSPHPPTGATGTVGTLCGWDFNTLSSKAGSDGVNHYYFDVTNGIPGASFTATATLVWNRQQGKTGINNLDLFLYDAATSNLVASSISPVDNVEQLFVLRLPAGRYDLQVLKHGGFTTVSSSETYALAFEFFSMPLHIAHLETGVELSWPVYPAGFTLESAANPAFAHWSAVNAGGSVSNGQNVVSLGPASNGQFFRLARP